MKQFTVTFEVGDEAAACGTLGRNPESGCGGKGMGLRT